MIRKLYALLLFTHGVVFAVEPLSCDQQCTFVLAGEQGQLITVVNQTRANNRFTPYSTFKIANTLIALDSKVINDQQQYLSFDRRQYPIQTWWLKKWYQKPLQIRDAFQWSAVPIFQQLASQIGHQNMTDYLQQFDYGNQDISSGLDSFWLNGSVKISALEQVEFLRAVFNAELTMNPKTLELFKPIMFVEQSSQHRLYAKSGAGPLDNGDYIGWYVGVVERGEQRFYFALNLELKTFQQIQQKRIKLARKLLQANKVLPSNGT